MLRLGVIGYGGRAQRVIRGMMLFREGLRVSAICDPRAEKIRAGMADDDAISDDARFYDDPDRMLDEQEIDGVLVGTRCSLHARMARKVLRRNLPLFLEKPVATSLEDLLALREAYEQSSSEVVVSFPIRLAPLCQLAKEIVASGKIGTVEHVQAWNNVGYGDTYYQDWYRDENETQGLFLQKATHDFDYLTYLLGLKPRWICAVKSKRIFRGDHPAGLRCNECPEREDCPQSGFSRFFWTYTSDRPDRPDHFCAFAVDTGNEDSGSAIIEYETGMHVVYSQNFFARRTAAGRGARLFGYRGTIEFDFTKNELKVHLHHRPFTEIHRYDMRRRMSHYGGDLPLQRNFLRVLQRREKSATPLEDGLLSALMCLKAKRSAETRTFQEIAWPDEENSPGRPQPDEREGGHR